MPLLSILAATLMFAGADDSGQKFLVDEKPVDLAPTVQQLKGIEVSLAKAVQAFSHDVADVKKNGKSFDVIVDGRVAMTITPGSDSGDTSVPPNAKIFDSPGSSTFRKVELDNDLEEVQGHEVMDFQDLGALFGVSVDQHGDTNEAFTSAYWGRELGLPKAMSADLQMNPLGLVPDFGISPPAKILAIWARPPKPTWVQIYRFEGGNPVPMLSINALTGEETFGEDAALPRSASSSKLARVETEHFATVAGTSATYAAIVSSKDTGAVEPLDAISEGLLKPGEYAIVGMRQRVVNNPVEYGTVKVEAGDTIAKISKRPDINEDQDLLRALNGLHRTEQAAVGSQLIYLKPLNEAPAGADYKIGKLYSVLPGETLESLASSWKVKIEDIQNENSWIDPAMELHPGDVLRQILGSGAKPKPQKSLEEIGSGVIGDGITVQTEAGQSLELPSDSRVTIVEVVGNNYRCKSDQSLFILPKGKVSDVAFFDKIAPPSTAVPYTGGSTSQSPVVKEALKYLGTPYDWGGGNLTRGIDCSHFVAAVYQRAGVYCPSPPVSIQELSPVVHVKAQNIPALKGNRVVTLTGNTNLNLLRPGDRFIIQRGLNGAQGSRHTGIYAGHFTYRGHTYYHGVIHACRPVVRINEITDSRIWGNYRFSVRDAQRQANTSKPKASGGTQ